MYLAEDLFDAYFSNEMDMNDLVIKMGINEEGFLEFLKYEMKKTCENQNSDRIENLIYALMLWDSMNGERDTNGLAKFLNILNDLLVSEWHCQHENIIMLLQKISDSSSLKYIYKAIRLRPNYLSWDDNFTFETKCVRAICRIGKKDAVSYLEELCSMDNEIIREVARKQLNKLN